MVGHGLVGRAAELDRLAALVADAETSKGGTTWIVGEAGIGKSALLHELRRTAGPRFLVLEVDGVEAEVELPWAGLHALLLPLLAEGLAERLAAPQRAALAGALRLAGSTEVEPFAVLLATRNLILEASASRPVLLLVDDVQWLDAPSRSVVEQLARRWQRERVAMVLTRRADAHHVDDAVTVASSPSSSETMAVGPLDEAAASALLASAGLTSHEVRRRLVDELGGRPLLLLTTAGLLSDDERSGARPLTGPLRLPASALSLAAARLRQLPEASQAALLVLATLPVADVDLVARAMVAAGSDLVALDEAERQGVVVVDHRVAFTHPTLRSAAYHGAMASARREAHRIAATVIDDPAVRTLHLALAASGPDADLLPELDRAAELLTTRGDPVAAAQAHQLAARAAPDAEESARRLRRAAELLVDTSEAAAATALLDRADLTPVDVAERARRARVRLRLSARDGWTEVGAGELRTLADEVRVDDPGLAVELLLEALPIHIRQQQLVEAMSAASEAGDIAEHVADGPLRLRAQIARGGVQMTLGIPGAAEEFSRFEQLLDEEGAARAGPFLADVVAPVLGFVHRGDDADQVLRNLEQELRRRSALPVLPTVLFSRAMLAHGRDLRDTIVLADEAVSLADELGQPSLGRLPASSMAVAAAMAGDHEVVARGAAWLSRSEDPVAAADVLRAEAVLALGDGRLDEAIAAYERLDALQGVGTGFMRWEAEWAEALLRAQRRDDARAVLDRLAAVGEHASGAGIGAAGINRVEAMLATDDDEATAYFETSLAVGQVARNKVAEGRTELVWGERLRRARRRAAARSHLERAVTLLEQVGAIVWADRARTELELAGGVAVGTDREGGTADLTSQELRVARLAASGASNKDIGHELYLSPRTVEAHLTAVFRKLGLQNRRELAARAVGDERLRPG